MSVLLGLFAEVSLESHNLVYKTTELDLRCNVLQTNHYRNHKKFQTQFLFQSKYFLKMKLKAWFCNIKSTATLIYLYLIKWQRKLIKMVAFCKVNAQSKRWTAWMTPFSNKLCFGSGSWFVLCSRCCEWLTKGEHCGMAFTFNSYQLVVGLKNSSHTTPLRVELTF